MTNFKDKKKLTVNFTKNEWKDLIDTATDISKLKFLVAFDNSLSHKLQEIGLKCWLRSKNNRFKKVFFNFKCILEN